MEASYRRWSRPVVKTQFSSSPFDPMVHLSVSLFHWLSFFLTTTLLFRPHFHFTLWFSDEPVTSPPIDRSSVAKKRFTLQGFSNLKSPKGNISSSGACWWSVIVGLCHHSCKKLEFSSHMTWALNSRYKLYHSHINKLVLFLRHII